MSNAKAAIHKQFQKKKSRPAKFWFPPKEVPALSWEQAPIASSAHAGSGRDRIGKGPDVVINHGAAKMGPFHFFTVFFLFWLLAYCIFFLLPRFREGFYRALAGAFACEIRQTMDSVGIGWLTVASHHCSLLFVFPTYTHLYCLFGSSAQLVL